MTTQEIWLICGGRDFSDARMFSDAMRRIVRERGYPAVVVHGGAYGADRMAENWAIESQVEKVVAYPAIWKRDGNKAGPLRNQRMLDDARPDVVISFPGGRGTADMVRRARATSGITLIDLGVGAITEITP